MDKVKICLRCARAISDTSGAVTQRDLDSVFALYEVKADDREKVLEALEINGINLVKDSSQIKTDISDDRRRKRFEMELSECNAALKKSPALLKKYQTELPMLVKMIATERPVWNKGSSRRIAKAVVSFALERERNGNEGIACPLTYLAGLRERLEKNIDQMLSEQELSVLLQTCQDGREPDGHQKNILMLLLHIAPKIVVRKTGRA